MTRNPQAFQFALTIIQFLTTLFVCSVSAGVHNHGSLGALYNNFTTYQFGQNYKDLSTIKSYFYHLGYISNAPPFNENFDDTFVSAIQTYQKNYRLNITGKLDHDTLRHMMIPRCGVPDIIKRNVTTTSFNKHPLYAFYNGMPRWPPGTTHVTYAFSPVSIHINYQLKKAIVSAFNRWTRVIKISFQEITSFDRANIKIGFFSKDHGDGYPFTGRGGVWAHATHPLDARIHFNADQNWKADVRGSNEPDAADLESIALHEIGHALGLDHSTIKTAVMYPYINSQTRKVHLADDDLQGIRILYGL